MHFRDYFKCRTGISLNSSSRGRILEKDTQLILAVEYQDRVLEIIIVKKIVVQNFYLYESLSEKATRDLKYTGNLIKR